MLNIFSELFLFGAKTTILVLLILILLAGILGLFSRSKGKVRNQMIVKNLNKKYQETKEAMCREILSKEQWKQLQKSCKKAEKLVVKEKKKTIFVLNFNGDIRASAVNNLREEVTAILGTASSNDEVIVKLESAGGMVHAYGLAASQLLRIREKNIPLTVIVDKVAASGGYMMAAVANKILAAPFAIIGSIGVVVQLPNFHRLLKEKNIDFEQFTAGQFKRTLTLFGENTEEGRQKLHEEIEDIHRLFKNLIKEYRPHLDVEKVATGEHWPALQALELQLIDGLRTSDDYLLEQSKTANLFEVAYFSRKSLFEKLSASTSLRHLIF